MSEIVKNENKEKKDKKTYSSWWLLLFVPLGLVVFLFLIVFIVAIMPFLTICFLVHKYYKYREIKMLTENKVKLKMKPDIFSEMLRNGSKILNKNEQLQR